MNRRLEVVESGILYANPYPGDWAIQAYFPRIVKIGPSELLCVYRRAQAMYADDARSFQLRSTDNGQSWQDEGCIWDGSGDERSYSYSATCVSMMSDGEIVLTGGRYHRPQPDLPCYNERTGGRFSMEPILLRSRDLGHSWSAPEPVQMPEGASVKIYGGVVELNDGQWLIPCDLAKDYDDPSPMHSCVIGVYSSDRGQSWAEAIPLAGGPDCEKTFWHARVIKLSDGRLLTFPWTGDKTGKTFLPLHRVVSDPSGLEWSPPEAIDVRGQTNCPVDLGEGGIALVYSFRETEKPGIYMALSNDYGRSWDTDHQVQIWDAYGRESIGAARTSTYPAAHDNIAYGAPDAIRLDNGEILASFWAGQSGQMVCRWCRLRM